ncbi:hypothetical protein MRB53_030331 [Persea americana]|uniref:Uncharacterized protein n=1 Tax=Persea americana TaxID=3435 RepID=A0ACC2KLA9_PERAE|nr:hypothetical protein MRB53_030331 [Persea americana]
MNFPSRAEIIGRSFSLQKSSGSPSRRTQTGAEPRWGSKFGTQAVTSIGAPATVHEEPSSALEGYDITLVKVFQFSSSNDSSSSITGMEAAHNCTVSRGRQQILDPSSWKPVGGVGHKAVWKEVGL